MDKSKFTIGEISKICDVTMDALRYYDEVKLLTPEHSDANRYRYYNAEDIWTLEIIKICRKMGISIDGIRKIFELNDNEKMITIVEKSESELEQRIQQMVQMKNDLNWFKEEWNELTRANVGEIQVKHFPKREVLYHDSSESMAQTQVLKETVIQDAVRKAGSVRRKYGFILDTESFLENCYYRNGEYVNLFQEHYPVESARNLLLLPEGDYICMVARSFKEAEEIDNRKRSIDMKKLLDQITERKVTPELVIAEEVGCPFFNLAETLYEIQVLPAEKK